MLWFPYYNASSCKNLPRRTLLYMNNADTHNSFQEFYNDNHDALFRFCITKVRDRHIAIDLVQESFIKLWDYVTQQGDFDSIEYPRALVYRIARNSIIDWSRKKKADSLDTLVETGLEFSSDDSLSETQMENDDLRSILQVIEYLAEPYRDVITMRYIDGLSVHEIAELTGDTTNVISVRIHRALEKLRIELEKRTANTATL